MGNGVPLLNEYKQDFFWKRFPQTLLGGPKLRLGYSAPVYIYISQVILFLIPLLIGGVFTFLVEYSVLTFDVGSYITGSLIFFYVLCVQLTSLCVQKKNSSVVPISGDEKVNLQQNFLSEEDELDFDSCCGIETLLFVAPVKKYKVNIFFHALLSGGLCGVGFWYLLPMSLNAIYGNNIAATVIIYIFGWFTLCIAQYSLTVGAPPEFATYRTLDTYELAPLSRPFHVILFCVVHIIARSSASLAGDFSTANQALHVLFIFLPLLWIVGLLSPLEAFCLWAMEQSLVVCLGGSAMASDIRLLAMYLVSVAIVIGAFYINSDLATVIILATTGYLFSIDLGGLGAQILAKCHKQNNSSLKIKAVRGFLWRWGVGEIFFHLFMMGTVGGVAAVINIYASSISASVCDILGYCAIGLTVVDKVLGDMQRVYVVFGMFRNFLYPANINKSSNFKRRKRRLNGLGYCRRCLFDFVVPFVLLVYLGRKITTFSNATFWVVLGAARSFRWIWQSTRHCLLEVSVLAIVDASNIAATNTTWLSLGTGLQLLVIGLCRNRIYEFCNKMYTYWVIFITSWKDKKQRRASTVPVMATSIFLYPLILAVILIATALSAPLLPLFTLPVFLIGFPRPLRCWPGVVGSSASVCPDTIFYRHLAPELAKALRTSFANGGLGDPDPGSFYLVRYQDRLVWILVLERGYSYCTVSIKGLELQETSCHTAEAARIDDIFQEAVELEKQTVCGANHHICNTMTASDAAVIQTYSDAKNVLTGIIDSPENLQLVAKSFIRCLVWVFLHHAVNNYEPKSKPDSITHENQDGGKQPSGQISEKDSKEERSVRMSEVTVMAPGVKKLPARLPPIVNSAKDDHGNSVSDSAKQQETDIDALLNDSWLSLRSQSPEEKPVLKMVEKSPAAQGSLPSFSGSSWSDDNNSIVALELDHKSNTHVANNQGARPNVDSVSHFSPSKSKQAPNEDFQRNKGGFFTDTVFGLPAVDVGSNASKPPLPPNPLFVPAAKLGNGIQKLGVSIASNIEFSSHYSSRYILPAKWFEIPMEKTKISALSCRYPSEWHQHVLDCLSQKNGGCIEDDVAAEIAKDPAYLKLFAQFVMSCYAVIYELGSGQTDPASLGTSHVYKVYTGEIPWSIASEWITDEKDLYALVLKAYRLAVKMTIDQALLGEASTNEDYEEYLTEYDRDWYIGMEKEPGWQEAVLSGKRNLLSLGSTPGKGVYSSRTLTNQNTVVQMASLNSEMVRAQWANLSLELLYMTNDDEERYSIQAHPTILRNLTVQAADPPLGYPIFSSEPISVPTL